MEVRFDELNLEVEIRYDGDGGVRMVVVDCASVEWMSSAGIRVIFAAARALAQTECRLAFCQVSHQVQSIFEMVHIDRAFPMYATRADALAALGGG